MFISGPLILMKNELLSLTGFTSITAFNPIERTLTDLNFLAFDKAAAI
ncbi:MAG: hypothetical protein ACOYWZ_23595 [Bacillota bacterium]